MSVNRASIFRSRICINIRVLRRGGVREEEGVCTLYRDHDSASGNSLSLLPWYSLSLYRGRRLPKRKYIAFRAKEFVGIGTVQRPVATWTPCRKEVADLLISRLPTDESYLRSNNRVDRVTRGYFSSSPQIFTTGKIRRNLWTVAICGRARGGDRALGNRGSF